ncbi:hypothetical protein PIB30_054067 [Stylosanthes scabra]|uniref:Uncharacterized protein n=1 Tax=Stylosanthes scabra TaxID=79078 RepID=A0ABU6VKP3_9FABA|nr:hypothetical protein [Stylosanthes scabra]
MARKTKDRNHWTRCNPSEVPKVYIGFSYEKKELVHEMGFRDLVENVSNFNFSNVVMMELVHSFLISTSTIKTNVAKVSINAAKIGYAFRLPATGNICPQKLLKKKAPRDQYDAADHFRKKSLAELRDMKAHLCPNNSTPLSPKTPPMVLNVTDLASMNWARHVYSFLLSGIQEMRRKNLKSVDGCIFALLIIYFHETHFREEYEKAEAQPPWLAYWKEERLQTRIKDEFEDPAGLVNQYRMRVPKTVPSAEKKKTTTTTKKAGPPKKVRKTQIMSSTLAKSLQMEEPKGKNILGKRKGIEEVASSESEHESEPEPELEQDSESESNSGTESDSDLEKMISEDEA